MVGFVVAIDGGATVVHSSLYQQYSSPDAFYLAPALVGLVPVLLGLFAVFAPGRVSGLLRLETSETALADPADLGDLVLRRSGILVACWLILLEVAFYCISRMPVLEISQQDAADLTAVVIVVLVGTAVWGARGWLADLLTGPGGSVCTACGCQSLDVDLRCLECGGATVGFASRIDSPRSCWGHNWMALLAAAKIVSAATGLAQLVYFWSSSTNDSPLRVLPWDWLAVWSFVIVVLWSLVLPLRRYVIRLLPRSASRCETFFRFSWLLMLVNSVAAGLFYTTMMAFGYPGIARWQTGVATWLVCGLILLYWPAAWLPGRGTDESPVASS